MSLDSAGLLPAGKQQFFDGSGNPLTSGTVTFYVPATTTYKDTWVDPGRVTLNPNPVVLNASGEAIIYGSGTYRQVVKDVFGNTIWDELVFSLPGPFPEWGGISTGAGNAQVLSVASWQGLDGESVLFRAGYSNTGATSVTVGGSAYGVVADLGGGPSALVGGEIVAGNVYLLAYDQGAGTLHLTNPTAPVKFLDSEFAIEKAANPAIQLTFSLANLSASRQWTAPDASGEVMLTGAGQTTIASATTTDLGASPTVDVIISGTTTISSFGTVAAGTYRQGYFGGALTLTYNATSMILPSRANITTAAGDSFGAVSLGSGNWKVLWYQKINGAAPAGNLGIGQAWVDVTSSRADSVTYQNTTGQSIEIAIALNNSTGYIEVSVDSITWVVVLKLQSGNSSTPQGSAIIPPGMYYRLYKPAGTIVLQQWSELR